MQQAGQGAPMVSVFDEEEEPDQGDNGEAVGEVGQGPQLLWIALDQASTLTAAPAAETPVALTALARDFARHCGVRMLDRRTPPRPDKASRHQLPDLLVFEYDYPDMGSLRLLRDIRERYPALPIIMFTVYHSEALAVWALRNRVWDFFVKPLPASELARITTELVRWHRRLRAGLDVDLFLGNPYPEEVRVSAPVPVGFDMTLAHNYLEQHCSRTISEQAVADLYGMSRFRFSREFKRAAGATFQDYLINFRMTRAKALLEKPGVLIADVASVVGFSDPAYFARVYKRVWGTPPSLHRIRSERLIN